MISYKRDVLERQSLSEVKMDRCSPICERVRKKIVEYFKNNVSQRQIAKALPISSSTVHNTIKVEKWKGASKHFFKSVLWSDESNFDILVGNHGCHVLRAKEEGDRPVSHQCSVQKPASLMVWGCISAYGLGSLPVLEGTMNAERYIKVLEQHMLPPPPDNVYFRRTITAITTAWLSSRRVRVLNWPACSPDLSPIENIWRFSKRKICQRQPQTL